MADQVLDVKGLNCPLPILRAKKALKDIPAGGTLQVLATDPGAVKDFEAFCRTTGNELLESKNDEQRLQLRDQAHGLSQIKCGGRVQGNIDALIREVSAHGG